MPSTATRFAWLSASMLRRWQAISVSTSKGRKRKSAMNLVTSKSKKLGRASDMGAGSGVGEVRVIVQCTTVPISGPPPPPSRHFLQCSNSGGNWFAATALPARWHKPALDATQASVQRRHRTTEIGGIVAAPHAHRRKISRGDKPDDHCTPDPVGWYVGSFEHPPHRAQQRVPGAKRGYEIARQFTAQHVERRLIGLERVESPHQQIEQPVSRPLVRLGDRGIGQHDFIYTAKQPAQDRLLRPKHTIYLQDRKPGRRGDRGERQPPPPLRRYEGEGGIDDPVGVTRPSTRRSAAAARPARSCHISLRARASGPQPQRRRA